MIKILWAITLMCVIWTARGAWKTDKVLLEDVKVLTLRAGEMTTGRRSAPVPQLKCVGGTAANSYVPQVVQCYNRGTDGIDVQWECKADMDNAYRFGRVEVVCEGYDYPDDPYILKGSCGLEYTLELTKEGYQQQNQGHHQYYPHEGHHDSYGSSWNKGYHKKSNWFGDVIMLVIVGVIIYAIYRTCIAGPDNNTEYWQDPNNTHRSPPRSGPPPPGFRDEYMPGNDDDSCHSTRNTGQTYTNTTHRTNTGNTGGGFWSGAATGGLLGYLFGSRTNTYQQPYHGHYGHRGWGSGWGGSGWGPGGGGSPWGSGWGSNTRTTFRSGGGGGFSSGSTGTRTASGFGSTRRR